MKTNMGTFDKVGRIFAAVVIAILYFTKVISGPVAIVLLIFAGVFIITSFLSFCPLYVPFGINTKQEEK
jgi:hypothetical protein